MSTIFEIVHFAFHASVPVEQQRLHLRTIERWVREQPGFVSRRFFHEPDHQRWVDVVEWRDRGAAQAAFARFSAEPTLKPVGEAIDGASVVAGHYDEQPPR